MDSEWALDLLDHPDAPVRLLGTAPVESRGIDRAADAARGWSDWLAASRMPRCRSELASTAARLEAGDALAVLHELIRRQEDVSDKHIPLRIWWALEEKITSDAEVVLTWLEKAGVWQAPLFTEHLAGRIARRLAADRGDTPLVHAHRSRQELEGVCAAPAKPDARRQG